MAMLSRTAANLFWVGRLVERADSMARLIEMGYRMAMLPGSYSQEEWRSVAEASGCIDAFDDPEAVNEAAIVRTLMLDRDNPSSIRSCLEQARANGRSERIALTTEVWEALNDGWRKLELMDSSEVLRDLPGVLDWVKARASMFRGTANATMLRHDRYDFVRLGAYVERADMTLRLLDVKYYVLLPETDVVGGGRDHHQWTSVLHATSAIRAYHHVYRGNYSPDKIADFLILNRAFPRSVAFSYEQIGRYLNELAMRYGARHGCHDTAAAMITRLDQVQMGELLQLGLHEFIQTAIGQTNRLSEEIYRAYYF